MAKYSVRESVYYTGKYKVVKKDWMLGWVRVGLPLFDTFDEAHAAAKKLKELE